MPRRSKRVFNGGRATRSSGRATCSDMGLVALLVFDLFLVGDYLMGPEHLERAAGGAAGHHHADCTAGGFVVAVAATGCCGHALPEAMFAVLYPILGCCLATLYLHHFSYPSAMIQAGFGTLLLLVVMNTMLRPDLWAAALGTVVCSAMFSGFLVFTHMFTVSEQWTMAGQFSWCAVLTLLANNRLLREQRFSWLLQMRGRILRQTLSEENRELLSLSMLDHLTGIPNRAAYERRLAELWQHSIENNDWMAVVMVDVDYFKQVNDSFGHLFGDRVLQRIAKLLEQSMRAELDFVARYGGEEFVVLLPGSTLEAGVHVAERIRMLVQVAGSPAVTRGDAPLPTDARWSTVSCGVAAVKPSLQDDPKSLIDAADGALYVAKHSGRNRVCSSGSLSLVKSA